VSLKIQDNTVELHSGGNKRQKDDTVLVRWGIEPIP
jgi:hypothetical protein